MLATMTEPARTDIAAQVKLASAWWPHYQWHRAQVHRGAFHDVLVIPGQAVARLGRHALTAARLADEHRILTVFSARHARWVTPKALSPVRATPQGDAGMLTSWIPGRHLPHADYSQVSAEITALVHWVATGEAFHASGGLAEPRAWCGGHLFPHIAADRLVPLLPDAVVREAARQAITDMLAAERAARPVPVHGDLGMHNILWHHAADAEERAEQAISGLIDLDHAAIGDPAIDVAPLLGQYGAAALAGGVAPPVLQRAMLHRATLSLQVAAAAELRHDAALRDFALANFDKRYRAGTLYDPDGARPDR